MLAENNVKRSNALRRLQASMNEADVAQRLIAKGEMDSPFEILACTHDGVQGHDITGQYYFPEYEAAENVCYFSAMMTILEEIPEEMAKDLPKRVEETNRTLPCGLFAIYPDVGLVYKLTIPVSEGLSDDDLFDTIDISAAHAIAISSAFAKAVL